MKKIRMTAKTENSENEAKLRTDGESNESDEDGDSHESDEDVESKKSGEEDESNEIGVTKNSNESNEEDELNISDKGANKDSNKSKSDEDRKIPENINKKKDVVKAENKKSEDQLNEEKERTIIIENLDQFTTRHGIIKLFKKETRCGRIEHISVSKRNIYDVIAFVRFVDKKSVAKACHLHGKLFNKRILNVREFNKRMGKEEKDKNTVFIGNLKRTVTNEKLHKIFSFCGEIEYVRTVQDEQGCKGFAFVCFKTQESATIALQFNNQEVDNRPMRVRTNAAPSKKKEKKNKKAKIESIKTPIKNEEIAPKKDKKVKEFEGKKIERTKKKNKLGKGLKQKKILAKKLTSRKKELSEIGKKVPV